jgi:hypothetical protein
VFLSSSPSSPSSSSPWIVGERKKKGSVLVCQGSVAAVRPAGFATQRRREQIVPRGPLPSIIVLTSSDIFATCKGTVKESPSLLICVAEEEEEDLVRRGKRTDFGCGGYQAAAPSGISLPHSGNACAHKTVCLTKLTVVPSTSMVGKRKQKWLAKQTFCQDLLLRQRGERVGVGRLVEAFHGGLELEDIVDCGTVRETIIFQIYSDLE